MFVGANESPKSVSLRETGAVSYRCSTHPPTDHRKGGVDHPCLEKDTAKHLKVQTTAEHKCFFCTCNMIWTPSGLYQEGAYVDTDVFMLMMCLIGFSPDPSENM